MCWKNTQTCMLYCFVDFKKCFIVFLPFPILRKTTTVKEIWGVKI